MASVRALGCTNDSWIVVVGGSDGCIYYRNFDGDESQPANVFKSKECEQTAWVECRAMSSGSATALSFA